MSDPSPATPQGYAAVGARRRVLWALIHLTARGAANLGRSRLSRRLRARSSCKAEPSLTSQGTPDFKGLIEPGFGNLDVPVLGPQYALVTAPSKRKRQQRSGHPKPKVLCRGCGGTSMGDGHRLWIDGPSSGLQCVGRPDPVPNHAAWYAPAVIGISSVYTI